MTNDYTLQQTGLSMVELLVALAISSFLILGITQVYIDNKRNYMFQQSQASNLDNSRFAVLMLDEILSKAGYRRAPDQGMEDAFPHNNTTLSDQCAPFPQEAVITKLKDTSSVGFCMRYQPATANEDLCDGNTTTLAKDEPFYYPAQNETIYLAIKYTPDDNKQGGTISCQSNKGGNAELLNGIADMQVEFASGFEMEKRLKDGAYKNAADWQESDGVVRAVRYSVLTGSRPGQRDGDSLVFSQWLANTASESSRNRLEARDSRNIYQAAIGSQAVRNMMP